jgi:uncharacterized membrane protein
MPAFVPTPGSENNFALSGEIHTLQYVGIALFFLALVISLLNSNSSEMVLHLRKALFAGSALLNISPVFHGHQSAKTLAIAGLFGLAGIIISLFLFFPKQEGHEEDEY